ncbi:MAG: hypothetical protein AAF483_12850 [Planctomycetota bacterium]
MNKADVSREHYAIVQKFAMKLTCLMPPQPTKSICAVGLMAQVALVAIS